MTSVFVLIRLHHSLSNQFSIVGIFPTYLEALEEIRKRPRITQWSDEIREYELGKPYREDGLINYIKR